MNSFVIFNMIIIMMAFVLMAFAVFTIGFLFGYKIEDKRILKNRDELDNKKIEESEQERKAKKEWKKFLEYDGSAPTGVE